MGLFQILGSYPCPARAHAQGLQPFVAPECSGEAAKALGMQQ